MQCKGARRKKKVIQAQKLFGCRMLLFFVWLVIPLSVVRLSTTAKTIINRGCKMHSFKQAIYLAVVCFFFGCMFVALCCRCCCSVSLFFCFTRSLLLCKSASIFACICSFDLLFRRMQLPADTHENGFWTALIHLFRCMWVCMCTMFLWDALNLRMNPFVWCL